MGRDGTIASVENNLDDSKYGEDIESLDLAKYGLAELAGRDLLTLEEADMDRLLLALGNDDISLNLPIACNAENVAEALGRSECRRCGRCCRPNPLNPKSPGVEAFEEELQEIARHLGQPYDDIKKRTGAGHAAPYAYQVVKLGFTRWLPLPCPFHDEREGCQAYEVRPLVCRVYPIIFTGDDTYLSIRAGCDYGKDVIKGACARLRVTDPTLVISL